VPNGQVTIGLDGSITLPAPARSSSGLPYLSDFETLSLNAQGQETHSACAAKSNPVIYLDCHQNAELHRRHRLHDHVPLRAARVRDLHIAISMQEGVLWTRNPVDLDSECHTCVRQNMPLPITIRMHIPQVMIGDPVYDLFQNTRIENGYVQ